MRHENLRAFLEVRGHRDKGKLALGAKEIADLIAAHEEIQLAVEKHQRPVRLGATRNDGHIEPVLGISAVNQRLVKAARLRVGHPVGAKLHLVEGERRLRPADQPRQRRHYRQSHPTPSALMAPRNADAARSKDARAGADAKGERHGWLEPNVVTGYARLLAGGLP